MIENGKIVEVHYTGKTKDDEKQFDSSFEREPLKFQIGTGQIIPGFESAILGKKVGDKVQVTVESKDGYGDVREDLIAKVKKEQLPGEVQIGQQLQAPSNDGKNINVVVTEINEDHVVVDANHPLAGKDLSFDIEVVNVEDAPKES
jgi:FKBP-type peptidyl-prolyl cis-trans isomerase 2